MLKLCFSVYRADLYQPFINSLVSCFNSDSVAFVGLTRAFATPKFFMLLKNHFVFTMLPLHVHDKPPLNNEIAVFVLKLK
jgi:hypothetical protein